MGPGRGTLAVSLTLGLSTAMSEQPEVVKTWHAIVESGDRDPALPEGRLEGLLEGLLADDVVFRSPAVFTPQQGKDLTKLYLRSALAVLGPSLRYVSEWYDQYSAVLEFEADLDGMYVHGVDMLRWNDDSRLVSFTVMVRPMRGLQKLIELMQRQLAADSHP
jgi:hypothetical protein